MSEIRVGRRLYFQGALVKIVAVELVGHNTWVTLQYEDGRREVVLRSVVANALYK
jgi:hypothetical protein